MNDIAPITHLRGGPRGAATGAFDTAHLAASASTPFPAPARETSTPSAAIQVERVDEAAFAGRFSLTLTGANAPATPTGNEALNAMLAEQLLRVPELAGERVEFHYRVHPEQLPRVRLDVAAEARGADADEALGNVRRLHRRLCATLAGRTDCAFQSTLATHQNSLTQRWQTVFPGLILPLGRGLVALRDDDVPEHLLLAAPSFLDARASWWQTLLGCALPVTAVVQTEPVVLHGAAHQHLARGVQMLRECRARLMDAVTRRGLQPTEVEAIRPALEQQLLRWLVVPRGVRISLRFEARAPLPVDALRMLARAMFPGRHVDVLPAEQLSRAGVVLDLGDCLHESTRCPELLPDHDMLALHSAYRPLIVPVAQEAPTPGAVCLGNAPGERVTLSDRDRARHLYVIGATGCGKSTLLLNLIVQDMAAGRGVGLIEPHGDLIEAVLARVPAHRIDDVVLIDASDYDHAVGLNFLEARGKHAELQRSFITNEMMKIFDRLYDLHQTGGPMFESYMRNALMLVMHNKIAGLTLCEVPLIFESAEVREKLTKNCLSEPVARFWNQQAERATGDAGLANIAPYITSKLNQFTNNALLRPIVGQSATSVDLQGILDERGILLVNLSKGLLGEMDSQLLGMLIIGKIFNAALVRARMPVEHRIPFSLFVDEFQSFSTDTMGMLLSESRKFGLQLVLANQHLAQIDGGARAQRLTAAVLANAGTLLAMRLGIEDALRLAPLLLPEIGPQEMPYLPDYHVVGRLLAQGRPRRPFRFETLPPPPAESTTDESTADLVRAHCRARYTRPVAAVEADIAKRIRALVS